MKSVIGAGKAVNDIISIVKGGSVNDIISVVKDIISIVKGGSFLL